MGYKLTINNMTTRAVIFEAGARFKFTHNASEIPIKAVNVGPGASTKIDSTLSGTCLKVEGVIRFKVGDKVYAPMMKTIENANGVPESDAHMELVQSPQAQPFDLDAYMQDPDAIVAVEIK